MPIFGLMYMLSDKISLGLSFHKKFALASSRRYTITYAGDSIMFREGTDKYSATANFIKEGGVNSQKYSLDLKNNKLINLQAGQSIASQSIPENYEIKTGIAFFLSSKTLFSFDLSYTDGYKKMKNYFYNELNQRKLIFYDNQNRELLYQPTRNIALGWEQYLNESFSFRIGYYSNQSNVKPINLENTGTAALAVLMNANSLSIPVGDGVFQYLIPELKSPQRREDIDAYGYTFSFSWEMGNSFLGFSYIREIGKGHSQLEIFDEGSVLPPNPMHTQSHSFYITAMLKR